jgi:hypothetical protein
MLFRVLEDVAAGPARSHGFGGEGFDMRPFD